MKSLLALATVVMFLACSSSPKNDAVGPNNDAVGPTDASDRASQRDVARGLKAHLELLAHDLLEGRGTGTRGYDIAAAYSASQLFAAGAQPAGDNGTYLQQVSFRKSAVTSSSMVVATAGKKREVKQVDEFLAMPSHESASLSASGPLVYVGFGVVSEKFGINDYKGLDVKDKVVLMLLGAPAQLPSEPRAHHGSSTQKLKSAFKRGAAAVIVVHSLQFEKVFPYEAMKHFMSEPRMTWMKDATTPHVEPAGAGPIAIVHSSLVKELFQSAGKDFDEVRRLADGKPAEGAGFDIPVELSLAVNSSHGGLTSPNVIGVVPGTDPALRDEHVVITAHLDHLGIGKPVEGDSIYNGALDNASGSAMVLELAHLFGAKPAKRSLLFVLVTGEEKGLLGSDYFARRPTVSGPLVADMNLDLVFWGADTKKVVFFGEKTSSFGTTARDTATKAGFEVIDDPMPEQALFVRSDHYSFVKQGVPSLFLGTGFDNNGAASNTYRKSHYHKPSDQVGSVEIDYAMGAKLVAMVADILTATANNPTRPAWAPGNFFTELYATP